MLKNLHLATSAIIVFGAALFYGSSPEQLLPVLFEFSVENADLKNIFRSIMGLYLGMAVFWVYGIRVPAYWRGATLSNICFMGGLGIGRLLSFIADGYSSIYFTGMILEFGMMIWGLIMLRKT